MKCSHCGDQVNEGVKFCPSCGAPMDSTDNQQSSVPNAAAYIPTNNSIPPVSPLPQKKKGGCLKIGLIVLGVIIVIGIINSLVNGNNKNSSSSTATTTANSSATSTKAASSAAATVAKTTNFQEELTNGYFTAGVDFPAGTYDLTAIKGGGNVSSSNAYTGGLNAVMGSADQNDSMYQQKYSNIKLPKGTVLSISDVVIQISSTNASSDKLTPKKEDTANKKSLSNGNFTAGPDFPAGTYDIVATSGGGNVSSSNTLSGGINAVMGTADKNTADNIDMYQQEFYNISLPKGTTLTIDSVTVDIIPVN